ncbi:hypothetical protein NXX60_26515 [Bacteroides thetaiotaomicron]|nr:hypothetical protein [Bacteroides thetaiotaomicron]UVQ22773.1 hypothetical protein NXX60_26515 [Bacteroides thetaiotaomicron]
MHTFLFVLPALHALVLFVVAVLLIKTIVALKSKPVFLSQTQALRIRTEDTCSRFNLNQEEAGKGWKVKVNFDTSKPADPETGLSPISNIEIEGNEKTVKTLLQEDDTIHVSESQETKNDLTLQQSKQSASHKDAGSSVAAGIDNGIKYGLIIGIPIILIILTLIIHARFKQKDSSK